MNRHIFSKDKRKSTLAVLFALAIPLILAGCINYEQTTVLNMDGSGTARIHYWAADDVVTFLSDGPLVFDEEKIKQRFSGEGVDVKSVKTELNEEDSTRHVYVDLSFDDIMELAKTGAFEDVDISWAPSGDMMKFTQTIKSGEDGGSLGMDEFTITYTYQMPGEIISSNATDHEGQTLTWKYKLSELGGDGVTMSATVKKSGTLADYAVTIAIVAGGILLIVILVIALRKKSAPQTVADVSVAPEAPPVVDPTSESGDVAGEADTDASNEEDKQE